ncbi:Transcriptional regulator [Indibacter alkaliphilus LW1]|jgi:LacI family transcriptional regulator|uniref:Transcriptional regulator n=1 Tax=Indibacter alkaliphilus (strain CCUG 57479 / KCTC 22604 / LW1) TaxID=1189612 RepID=S2DUK2_INDAL|nr:LacI family DNA-binding transcriptional regulator [Indibacter alkaliphilus]EOZ95771.1 Transcriptional regulator [Indibacter alkaliphilus LW1]
MMAKKRVSIKDIAKKLGISITTVSFIINGKAREQRISEELIKKVQDYIDEIGYKPNHVAQSLRLGKSKVIVFMAEDISNQFFASIARLIEEKAYQNGYKIIYCSTDNDHEKAKELISTFKMRNVDGFIITPTPNLEKDIKNLLDEGFPVVLFDRWIPDVSCSHVIVQNEESAYQGTMHLIEKGCRNLCFVSVMSTQSQMIDRARGFRKAAQDSNVDYQECLLKFHNLAEIEPYEKLLEFFEQRPGIDGVFFATNYLAFEGLQAMGVLQRQVPEKLKVVSFDDHYFFNLYKPKITAIEQPLEMIAEKLMETMLEHLGELDKVYKPVKVVLANRLNERESTL